MAGMILYQMSIEELMKQPDWPEPPPPELYHPDGTEKVVGRHIAVFEEREADGSPIVTSQIHILPVYGSHHELSVYCWCGTQTETTRLGGICVFHFADQ